MSEQKKDTQLKQEASKKIEGASKAPASSWKRTMSKKWVFPAIYLAAAAIILTLMWVYQDARHTATSKPSQTQAASGQDTAQGQDKAASSNTTQGAVPVTASPETMQWPVADTSQITVVKGFYDSQASSADKQAAMVEYDNTYKPNMGIDIARSDHQSFAVLAALGGKVTRVANHPIVGNLVEITSSNGDISIYQSLSNVQVKMGETVKQGEVLAEAGRNDLEKSEGIHVHFEVRKSSDNSALNPTSLLPNLKNSQATATQNQASDSADSSASGANASNSGDNGQNQ